MKFFVSRQTYWGVEESEGTVVEIACGGSDYANPDMLSPRWPTLGEGQEFTDPREAVKAGIAVCDAWRAAGEIHAKLAYGATGGNTLPFDPAEYEDAQKWADEKWEKAEKCDECAGILPDKRDRFGNDYTHGDHPFCSTSCAEKIYYRQEEENAPDTEDENA